MKKKSLVQRLYKEYSSQYSKKKIYQMVNFLINRMRRALLLEEGLKVSGFGSFRKKGRRILFKPSKKVVERLKLERKKAKMYL